MKRMQGQDAEKLLSQWEKVAKCNFKSKAQVHERCFFSWNEMLFAMQKTDFHVLELFCRASHVRASMHRITSLELLRTLMLCLVQLSKWREWKAKMLKSFFLSERKLLNAILRVKLKYMKDVSFSWNEMLFAMQKTDFHVLELFCRASHVRASMHRITSLELLRTLMLCLVQLSKWRMQGHGCWKASFSVREVAKCNFKSKAQVHERCFFSHEMKCYLQCRRQIFMC